MKNKIYPNNPTPSTQFIIWDSQGREKIANVIIESNKEALYFHELLIELRDTERNRYQMSVV